MLTNPSHQNENKNVPFVIITTQLLRFTTYHPMFDRFKMTGASSAAGNAYTPEHPSSTAMLGKKMKCVQAMMDAK